MTLHRKKCLSEGKEKKNTQSKFFEVIKRSKVKKCDLQVQTWPPRLHMCNDPER